MTLLEFARFLRHNFRYLVLLPLLGLVVAAGYAYLQPVVYQSVATGIVVAGDNTSVGGAMSGHAPGQAAVQHKTFNADNAVGLSQVLVGDVAVEDALQPTNEPNLYVLTSGRVPSNPSEMVGSKRMRALIEKLAENYFVITDAPPILAVIDAPLLAASTDGVVRARCGRLRRHPGRRGRSQNQPGHATCGSTDTPAPHRCPAHQVAAAARGWPGRSRRCGGPARAIRRGCNRGGPR